VTTDSPVDLLKQGATILRRQGPVAAAKAGLRVVNLNYRGYWWYLQYLYRKHVCRDCQTTEPFSVINVDPNNIIRSVAPDIDRWDDLGAVLDGDWDQTEYTVNDHYKYRSVVDHFENGTPWEETDVYRESIKRIERGESYWNGSLTRDDIEARTTHIEQLHERIKENGFKSQAQLQGKPLGEIVCSRTFDRSMEEIAVAIGRDGELLFVDGNHRLAIAHLLDLEAIPVHVIVRHEQWERTRQMISSSKDPVQLDEISAEQLNHPDTHSLSTRQSFGRE